MSMIGTNGADRIAMDEIEATGEHRLRPTEGVPRSTGGLDANIPGGFPPAIEPLVGKLWPSLRARIETYSSGQELTSPWPSFMDQLQSDAGAVFEGLYHFARRVFQAHPPRRLRSLQREDREDVLQDLVYHCCKDDFRVLRTYRNQGSPFACWLRRVADRKIVTEIDRKTRETGALDQFRSSQEPAPAPVETEHVIGLKRAIEITLDCLDRLDEESRLLIYGSASGLKPREMTSMMGWHREDNKRLSEKCRYARKKLKAMLREAGVDLASLLPEMSEKKEERVTRTDRHRPV